MIRSTLIIVASLLGLQACGPTVSVEQQLMADSGLLALAQQCPADLYQGPETAYESKENWCKNRPSECLGSCNSGDGNDCFNLANTLQQKKSEQRFIDALFAKACANGVSSGCTNLSAAAVKEVTPEAPKPKVLDCALRTFELTCNNQDPWGCLMRGVTLTQHPDLATDPVQAPQSLFKSCSWGDTHPACQSALGLLHSMGQIKAVSQTGAPAAQGAAAESVKAAGNAGLALPN